jgi:hypothetical protein
MPLTDACGGIFMTGSEPNRNGSLRVTRHS